MPLEDFELLEELGKGAFGVVRKCKRKVDGQIYAIKQVRIDKLKEKDKENALNEIRILASVTSPYIIGYKEAFYDEKSSNLCVVLEFADGGDLTSKIKQNLKVKSRFKEIDVWSFAFQLLRGLQKMHSHKILHRDIKSANIFFSKDVAKLGDLNISKLLKEEFAMTQTGTPYYACPEVWSEEPYGPKGDVWSLGIVLYEMCCFEPPFKAKEFKGLYKKIMAGDYSRLPVVYSNNLGYLIGRCLVVDSKKRASVDELLEMNEFKVFAKKEVELAGDDLEDEFLKTIKLPKNLKELNGVLPDSNYDTDKKKEKEKQIETEPDVLFVHKKGSLSRIPSETLIGSEKRLNRPPSVKNILGNQQQNYTKLL